LHSGKKLLAAALSAAATGAAVIGLSVSSASPGTQADPATPAAATTQTPIKHVVVLFDENISFDHYFATYPYAQNKPGEPPFHALPNTPSVNGLSNSLLTANPNSDLPQRLAPSQALTCDQNHGYTAEQSAFDMGLMDKFVQDTTGGGCTQTTFPDSGSYGPNGIVMDYYDGNTVTGLWNLAQHFTLNDEDYSTQFGPSTPGALNLISGNTNGTTLHGATTDPGSYANGTMIGDVEPLYDQCSNASKPLNTDGTPGGITASLSGTNVGDLLNRKSLTWGWFQGGFTPSQRTNGRAICGSVSDTTSPDYLLGKHDNIGNSPSADYSEHHEPFQYYASTSNPNHLLPSSVSQVGTSAPTGVNHQYDLTWFNQALAAGNMPSVSFLKAPEYEDGHAGYSDPLDEQRFLVDEINQIEQSPDWSSTAVVIAYDDSDGWYDHQEGPIIRQSQDVDNDTLSGPGKCGSGATAPAQNDRCGLGTRMPLLVISPWAKQNYVDSTTTDQSSITQFIEDNWNLSRIGSGSADSAAGSLMGAFDFNQKYGHAPAVILDDNTGEVSKTIPPSGPGLPSGNGSGHGSGNGSGHGSGNGSGHGWGSGSGSGSSGGSGSGHPGSAHGSGVTITLPNVGCVPKFSKRGLTLVCTTKGGSHVATLIRIRLFRGRSLIANQASRVKGHTARFTVRKRLRKGTYKVRVTVDAAGRVGAQTRTLRVR
jgi:phospholipase C